MTDTAIAETPAEIVPPAPEAAAELEAAPPLAEAPAERAMPEIEYPIGPLRQAVLDALADADEPLSVSRILAEMPVGTSRGSAESAIKREYDAGRIERIAAGMYRLARTKPPEQAKLAPQPSPIEDEAMWFAALEAWVVERSSWDVEKLGPPPNRPNNIPADIKARFNDRLRKRKERRREAEAAATARTAADAELRAKLLAATGGNFQPGPALDDVAPIRLAMELVPIDRILSSVRNKTDRRMYPANEPATSWREQRLLLEIAESYCRTDIVPRLVDAWSKAGRAPAPGAQSLPPAAPMADVDELRGLHDDPHAPPGPHIAGDAAPDVSQEARCVGSARCYPGP